MRIEYKMLSFKFIFAGSSSNSIKITDVTPSPYRLVVGGQFSLTCVYEGDINETIIKENLKFYKDDIQIPIAGEYSINIFTAGKVVTLTLQSYRENGLEIQDGGKYECKYPGGKSFQKLVDVFASKFYFCMVTKLRYIYGVLYIQYMIKRFVYMYIVHIHVAFLLNAYMYMYLIQ
jgi:hypothetical protein